MAAKRSNHQVNVNEDKPKSKAEIAELQQKNAALVLIHTGVTEGQSGNGERLAFIFDTRRGCPSGLVLEQEVP